MRILISLISLVIFVGCTSTKSLPYKSSVLEEVKNAKEPGRDQFVLMKDGTNHNIKSISFTDASQQKGRITTTEGKTIDWKRGDVIAYQDNSGFYRLRYYTDIPTLESRVEFLLRRTRGGISIYFFGKREYKNEIDPHYSTKDPLLTSETSVYYYVEKDNSGQLALLKNDKKVFEAIGDMVKESKAATKIIDDLKLKTNKVRSAGSSVEDMLEAVRKYNEEYPVPKISL